jgi:hypothetical protein
MTFAQGFTMLEKMGWKKEVLPPAVPRSVFVHCNIGWRVRRQCPRGSRAYNRQHQAHARGPGLPLRSPPHLLCCSDWQRVGSDAAGLQVAPCPPAAVVLVHTRCRGVDGCQLNLDADLVVVRRLGFRIPCPAYLLQGKHALSLARLLLTLISRNKIVELHASNAACSSALPNNDVEDAAAAPALRPSDDEEYDPDIECDPGLRGLSPPTSRLPSLLPLLSPRIRVVDSAAAAAAAMAALEEHDVFAVDLEGVELGRGGTISILQVCWRHARLLCRVTLRAVGCGARR